MQNYFIKIIKKTIKDKENKRKSILKIVKKYKNLRKKKNNKINKAA